MESNAVKRVNSSQTCNALAFPAKMSPGNLDKLKKTLLSLKRKIMSKTVNISNWRTSEKKNCWAIVLSA